MARAKSSAGSPANEYAGTDSGSGSSGDAIPGGSEPIDPDSALSGSGGGNSGGSGGSGSEQFDPAIHVSPDSRNADGSFTKRRGRKRGGSASARPQASKADLKSSIEALTKTLVIVHAGIAGVTKTPELEIDKDEGELLARAAANVMEQFDLTPDPKTQAIVGFVMACGTVYGPRAVMVKMRKEQERQEKRAANGMGTAGVYGANGEPMGTTVFSTGDPITAPAAHTTN